MMRCSSVLLPFAVWLGAANHAPASVRVGVFSLFHPHEITMRAVDNGGISVRTDQGRCALERGQEVRLRATETAIQVICAGDAVATASVHVGRAGSDASDMELSIPGRITRRFRGSIDVTVNAGELVPVVSIDLETAVASVVAAEQTALTPIEALKAQAVAARSYFVAAHGRHRAFDFCDTTHCQFLRAPPEAATPAARAAAATAGLVLAFRGAPIAALYSASCGGRTRTLADAGLSGAGEYPYFSVECPSCRLHPREWETRLAAAADLERLAAEHSERARLEAGRRRGWAAVPGNDFEISREDDGAVVIRGRGAGHGIGLCQAGAAALAGSGAPFRDILTHYYPGTTLIAVN
jgi:peptidoglycan hydrolase-like amidase